MQAQSRMEKKDEKVYIIDNVNLRKLFEYGFFYVL